MTHRANARLAGFTFLFDIVVGAPGLVVQGKMDPHSDLLGGSPATANHPQPSRRLDER